MEDARIAKLEKEVAELKSQLGKEGKWKKEKKDLFEVSEEAKKLYNIFGIEEEDELPNIDYIQPTFRIINNITKYLTEEVSDGTNKHTYCLDARKHN